MEKWSPVPPGQDCAGRRASETLLEHLPLCSEHPSPRSHLTLGSSSDAIPRPHPRFTRPKHTHTCDMGWEQLTAN